MSGNKIGGLKAAATNKRKHGPDFYAKIGAKGGAKGRTGGFFANPELARIAGAKGGAMSRRGPSSKKKASLSTTKTLDQGTTTEFQGKVALDG